MDRNWDAVYTVGRYIDGKYYVWIRPQYAAWICQGHQIDEEYCSWGEQSWEEFSEGLKEENCLWEGETHGALPWHKMYSLCSGSLDQLIDGLSDAKSAWHVSLAKAYDVYEHGQQILSSIVKETGDLVILHQPEDVWGGNTWFIEDEHTADGRV